MRAACPLSRCEGRFLFRRLFLIAFFIEVGLLLIVLPWSAVWERNYFMERVPALHAILTNYYVRGGVSGLGLVNLVVGFAELVPFFAMRARQDVAFVDEVDSQVGP